MSIKRKLIPLAAVSLIFASCGGGGGGGASSTSSSYTTVSGQVLSSFVEGISVCTPHETNCVSTDRYGRFSITVPYGTQYLELALPKANGGYFVLGTFNVTSSNLTVYPTLLVDGNATLGAVLRTFIHALGGDLNGNATTVNLGGVEVEAVADTNGNEITNQTLSQVLLGGLACTVNATLSNGTSASFKLYPQNKTLEFCTENSCQTVNATAYNWLVLVYVMGDNNLSTYATQTINQLGKSKYSPSVKVVALLDTYGDYGISLYESLDNGSFVKVADLPENNTANATYLFNFIKNAVIEYPSQKIALILWDHGGGWLGGLTPNFYEPSQPSKLAGSDESSNGYLYMHQLREALEKLKSEGVNIDLIGFDECSMATLEVAYDVSVNTKYVVASEYLESALGWNYTDIMNRLNANPNMDGWTFAQNIVDAYRDYYSAQPWNCYNGICTLSAYSIETVQKLVNATDGIAAYYLNNISANSSIHTVYSEARNNTNVIDNDTWLDNHTVDLYNFAYNLNGSIPVNDTQTVMDVINGEIYTWTNYPELYHGIGIYFPTSPNDDDGWASAYYTCTPSNPCTLSDDPNYYNPFGNSTWAQFIGEFVNY